MANSRPPLGDSALGRRANYMQFAELFPFGQKFPKFDTATVWHSHLGSSALCYVQYVCKVFIKAQLQNYFGAIFLTLPFYTNGKLLRMVKRQVKNIYSSFCILNSKMLI